MDRPDRCLPIGAEILPTGGGAHFRVWAPRRNQVEVVLEEKTGTILDVAAVLIGAPIGWLMQKLLNQVDETRLNLNTIEACIFRNLSSAAIVGNCLLDVSFRHLSRSFTHHGAAGGVNQLLWIDGGGS